MTWSFREYYRKNRAKIATKRRSRYRTDPNYRRTIRLRSHLIYHKKRQGVPPKDRQVMLAEGERLITIGKLAQLIGRDITVIRKYHRDGIIPDPTHFDSRGWRLYTRAEVSVIQLVFRMKDQKSIKGGLKTVKEEIAKRWPK